MLDRKMISNTRRYAKEEDKADLKLVGRRQLRQDLCGSEMVPLSARFMFEVVHTTRLSVPEIQPSALAFHIQRLRIPSQIKLVQSSYHKCHNCIVELTTSISPSPRLIYTLHQDEAISIGDECVELVSLLPSGTFLRLLANKSIALLYHVSPSSFSQSSAASSKYVLFYEATQAGYPMDKKVFH